MSATGKQEKKRVKEVSEVVLETYEVRERYRPAEPGVVEVPKVVFIGEGKELKAKVRKIRVGRVKDFIPIDKIADEDIREYYQERADRPAFNIEFEVPELGIVGEDTIIFSTHPNSRYIRLSRRYGEIKVGDEVNVVNEGGKLKIQ